MVESAYTKEEYIKQYSILRNPRFWRVFCEARSRCMFAAVLGEDISTIPLYSHNATYQSVFSNGWKSVTEQDIRLFKATAWRSSISPYSSTRYMCRCKL